jgi:hypothetical protein
LFLLCFETCYNEAARLHYFNLPTHRSQVRCRNKALGPSRVISLSIHFSSFCNDRSRSILFVSVWLAPCHFESDVLYPSSMPFQSQRGLQPVMFRSSREHPSEAEHVHDHLSGSRAWKDTKQPRTAFASLSADPCPNAQRIMVLSFTASVTNWRR